MLTSVTELLTVFLVFRKRVAYETPASDICNLATVFYPDDVLCVYRLVDHHDGAGA